MRQKGLSPGVVLAEEELVRIVSPLYSKLWQMIRQPFDDLLIRRGSDPAFRILDEGETAQWLRPRIVEHARGLFDGDPLVELVKTDNQFYMRYRDQCVIVPEKLRRRDKKGDGLTFSSYNTRRNAALRARRAEDGLPDLPRLIIGHLFIQEMTDVKIWIAHPRGKSAGIYLIVPDQDGGIMGIYEPGPDDGPPDDKGFRVRPTRKALPETGEA